MTNLRARVEGVLERVAKPCPVDVHDDTECQLTPKVGTDILLSILSEVLEECLPEKYIDPDEDSYGHGSNDAIDQTRTNLKERMKL